ncbi:hypothetical protein SAMN05216390_101388 [Lachnospiraceae bacterium KH1T2]|nr:hypothetical protein SAMN05216390_101388 [Lachnospiraceae bacterium KH1T2]
MGVISWLKNSLCKNRAESLEEFTELEEDEELREVEPIKRSSLNIRDKAQRDRYIKNCCEQMQESIVEIDKASMEYRLVTDYLKDIEEIEAAPEELRTRINKIAERITKLDHESALNRKSLGRIGDEEYNLLARYETEVRDDLEKIKKNEEFRELVRGDLQRLESEKAVYSYQKSELRSSMKNIKNLLLVTIAAASAAMAVLLVLYAAAGLDIRVGLMMLGAIAALALTGEYLAYSEAVRKLNYADAYITVLINKQNTVKIRYVNVTNLIEYEYRKYHISASIELEEYWNAYQEEKKARDFILRANSELSLEKSRLVQLMRDLHLKDPVIWARQCEALYNPKEMVEIRHDLNTRRQSLRQRIQYNTANRDASRSEINDIVKSYPEYGQEVLGIVASYNNV